MGIGQVYLDVMLSLIGMGYAWSGKKNGNGKVLICGLILGVFPYFVSNVWLLLIVGLALIVYPFLKIPL
jgi:hypothetical protein